MKEKKIVLSVIVGVSLVALIIALVAGLADSLSLLIDGKHISDIDYSKKDYGYVDAVGVLELCAIALGMAFVTIKICSEAKPSKSLFVAETVLAALLTVYLIVTAIVLRMTQPLTAGDLMYAKYYTLFTSYLTTAITVTVSALLAYFSSLFLSRAKKEREEIKQDEQQ